MSGVDSNCRGLVNGTANRDPLIPQGLWVDTLDVEPRHSVEPHDYYFGILQAMATILINYALRSKAPHHQVFSTSVFPSAAIVEFFNEEQISNIQDWAASLWVTLRGIHAFQTMDATSIVLEKSQRNIGLAYVRPHPANGQPNESMNTTRRELLSTSTISTENQDIACEYEEISPRRPIPPQYGYLAIAKSLLTIAYRPLPTPRGVWVGVTKHNIKIYVQIGPWTLTPPTMTPEDALKALSFLAAHIYAAKALAACRIIVSRKSEHGKTPLGVIKVDFSYTALELNAANDAKTFQSLPDGAPQTF